VWRVWKKFRELGVFRALSFLINFRFKKTEFRTKQLYFQRALNFETGEL